MKKGWVLISSHCLQNVPRYLFYGIGMRNWWLWVTIKTYGVNNAKKLLKFPIFFRRIFSRFNWGLTIVKIGCLSHTIHTEEELGTVWSIAWFIPFSKNSVQVQQFMRLCKSPLRNRSWHHRSSGMSNRQFRSWSIRCLKPFDHSWST